MDEYDKASNIKLKLYFFLRRMHLLNAARMLIKPFRAISRVLGIPGGSQEYSLKTDARREKEFHESFEGFLREIKAQQSSVLYQTVLFSGYLSTFTKGGNLFFSRLLEFCKNTTFIAISQSGKAVTEREKDKIQFELLTVPRVPFKGGYDIGLKIRLTEEMKQTFEAKEYLRNAAVNIRSYHDDMGEGYAEALVYYTYQYATVMAEIIKPAVVIVHNKLYPMHDIIVQVCRELGIKTLYFEFGALPGTFALEDKGQMGASEVAVDFQKFTALPVTAGELNAAETVIEYLRKSGLNRNIQPKTAGFQALKERLKPQRPILLYAGQNDFDSGICPYTDDSRRYHSPVFQTSDEAAIYLAGLAEKYDWNLIYKPHPLPVKHGRCLEAGLPDHIIWISDADINEVIDISDVVITILSQCGEVALIRGKATLMLGYTQLKGKGCCYEAFTRENIEPALLEAVRTGNTIEQRTNFKKYVAQTLKYYLYDDLNERELRFGRGIGECAEYLKRFLKYDKHTNVLACCSSYFELATMAEIMRQFGSTTHIDILLIGSLKEQERPEFQNLNIRKTPEVMKIVYDAFFIPDLETEEIAIYEKLLLKNPAVELHLYDNGKVTAYYKDIPRSLAEDFGEFSKTTVETVKKNLSNIYLYGIGLMVWKNFRSSYHPIRPLNIEKGIRTDRKELVLPEITETFIFLESECFDKRITCNELDLLEAAAEAAGKANIIVKLYSEESRLRFRMRGYKTFYMSSDEWFLFRSSGGIGRQHIIVSLYPQELSVNQYISGCAIRQIFLYKLFVGQYSFLKSRSFSLFITRYTAMLNHKQKLAYTPCSAELLRDAIQYLGRNSD